MTFVHEVETAFQKGQIGKQTAWGTAVVATIALGSISLTPAMKKTTNPFMPKGVLLPTILSTGREHTEVNFEGVATYEEIEYFLYNIVSDSQIDPLKLGEERIWTLESGGLQIPNAIVSSITLTGDQDQITTSGTMIGCKAVVATPTPGITAPAQTPISAPAVSITVGSTTIQKAFNWELSINDMWKGVTFIGNSTFANIYQSAIDATFKFTCEADSTGVGLLEKDGVLPVVISSTSGSKSITIEFDAKVGEPDAFEDEDGIYALGHNLTVMNSAGNAISVAVV